MIEAARRGQLKAIIKWLRKGQVNAQCASKEGNTLLHSAVINQQVDIVRELIVKRSADVDRTNHQGSTALMAASETGGVLEVQLLLNNGANVNKQRRGATALMTAAMHKRDEVLLLLLDAGAEVDMQAEDGETALMLAARAGSDKCVQLLLEAGASAKLRSTDGKTALECAREDGKASTTLLQRLKRALKRASAPPPASQLASSPDAPRLPVVEAHPVECGQLVDTITLSESAVRRVEPPNRKHDRKPCKLGDSLGHVRPKVSLGVRQAMRPRCDESRRAMLAKALRD
jgi:ankyrin repeat protein